MYGLLSAGCRVVVPLAFGVCPLVGEVGLGACVGFLVGGTDTCTLVCGSGPCPSCGQRDVKECVWVVFELSATLGSLSADDWGSVPILIVVWLEVFRHWSFQAIQ